MARQIVVGIDIGTSEIKVVIAESIAERGKTVPRIIGTGTAESRGVYRGYITDTEEASKSVAAAVAKAEKMAGVKTKRAYVSFGGIGLSSVVSDGSIAISKADMEVSKRDLESVLDAAEAILPPAATLNKRVINRIPIEYKTDGNAVWGRALGQKAQKLEVKALFITCVEQHLADLIDTVEEAGLEVMDVVAAPIASSFVILSKKQRRVGCMLADIGAETTSVVIFENNNIVSLQVFPIGSNDITNDIALDLKITLEEAEHLKFGDDRGIDYSKKKLDDAVLSRLKELFKMIDAHLKSIGRDALLPAGVILAGGGASTSNARSIAADILKLPAQLAEVHFSNAAEGKIRDRSWAVACGLTLVGFNADDEQSSIGVRGTPLTAAEGKRWGKMILRWFSQFLP